MSNQAIHVTEPGARPPIDPNSTSQGKEKRRLTAIRVALKGLEDLRPDRDDASIADMEKGIEEVNRLLRALILAAKDLNEALRVVRARAIKRSNALAAAREVEYASAQAQAEKAIKAAGKK